MTAALPNGQEFDMQITPVCAAALHESIAGFGPKLAGESQSKLKKVGDDIADAVRRKVMESPRSHGSGNDWGTHNSRQQVANAVSADVESTPDGDGVVVSVDPSKMAPGRQPFPFAYNKQSGWLHPVFGKGMTGWVHQQGNPFMSTTDLTAQFGDRAGEELTGALDTAAGTVKGE